MAINPIVYTEKVVRSFLRYQLTAYPFADVRLHSQMRRLLSLDETRQSPLKRGKGVKPELLTRRFLLCAGLGNCNKVFSLSFIWRGRSADASALS